MQAHRTVWVWNTYQAIPNAWHICMVFISGEGRGHLPLSTFHYNSITRFCPIYANNNVYREVQVRGFFRLIPPSVMCLFLGCIIVKITYQFTTPFKDHIRQLAYLKQQTSQKIILLCSTSPKYYCDENLLWYFYNNICCFSTWFSISLPNFIQTGPHTANWRRHVNFSIFKNCGYGVRNLPPAAVLVTALV